MEKQKPLPIAVIHNAFIPVPRCWVDKMMSAKCTRGNSKAPRIPNSFWKYTLVLWRHITNGNVLREATLANSQFPVRRDDAVKWSNAYAVSGLFTVTMGKYTAEHDQPNFFRYCADATELEWECFIRALDLTLNLIKDADRNRDQKDGDRYRSFGNTGAFRFTLAHNVDVKRKEAGLPAVNDEYIKQALAGIITDSKKRPIAELDAAGNPQPIFYPTHSHPRRGETEEEFEERLCADACYGSQGKASWER